MRSLKAKKMNCVVNRVVADCVAVTRLRYPKQKLDKVVSLSVVNFVSCLMGTTLSFHEVHLDTVS